MTAARAFFGYVHEITNTMGAAGQDPHWVVHVREGSALLAVEPAKSAPLELIEAVYTKAESGIRFLAAGEIEQSGLSEPALKHLRILSQLTEGHRGRPNPL